MTAPLLFISHSSADAAAAREIRSIVDAAGYRSWLAPDDVTGVEPWAEQILRAIDSCHAMVILVSARANQSRHVSREVQLASSRGRAIVPLRLEPVAPEGALEYHLAGLQRIDAFPPPIAGHRDEIVRRLRLIVPPATSAGASSDAAAQAISSEPAPAAPSPAAAPTETVPLAPVGPREPARPARAAPRGGSGLSAWARANSMIAGSLVTLVALFVVATLGFALSSPQPTASPGHTPGPTGVGPGDSLIATTPPTPPPPTVGTPSFPPVSGGPFPNDAERVLFAAIPESGKSDIEACERQDNLEEGAAAGIICHADDRELLFYEGYPDSDTLRQAYIDTVTYSFGDPDGSCATSPVGDAGWTGSDGRLGRLACGVNSLGLYFFYWTDESRLIAVSWYSGYDVNVDAERAKGYQVFLNWSGG